MSGQGHRLDARPSSYQLAFLKDVASKDSKQAHRVLRDRDLSSCMIGRRFGNQEPLSTGPARQIWAVDNLRSLRDSLLIALRGLEDGGNFVMAWAGLPHHPALLFLVSRLRLTFDSIHLNISPGVQAFEIYVLGFNYIKEK